MFLVPPIGLTKRKSVSAAVAFVGISGATNASGTLNLSLPGGVIEGDLMIAFVKTNRGGVGESWSSNDGAFTQHFDNEVEAFGSDDWDIACFSKVAGSSESGPYGFQCTNTMRSRQGMMVAYRNQHATPYDIAPTSMDESNKQTSSTSMNIAEVSPTGDDGILVLCAMMERDNFSASAAPTVDPATKRLWQQDTDQTEMSMGVFDEQLTASGATGTRNIQFANTYDMVAFRLVIKRAK
jgi:hypothetical protein